MNEMQNPKERLEEINNEIEKLGKEVDLKTNKLYGLRKMRQDLIFRNGLYITDLSEYEGKVLRDITAIDSKGGEVVLPMEGIVEVRNGKLYCSSYWGGIIMWSDEENCYYHHYCYTSKKLDIVGFYDIEVDDGTECQDE